MSRLTEAKQGAKLVMISIAGGMGAEKRLAEMGLYPGEQIKIINNSGTGPVTIGIKGTKLALGQGLAQKILVREV